MMTMRSRERRSARYYQYEYDPSHSRCERHARVRHRDCCEGGLSHHYPPATLPLLRGSRPLWRDTCAGACHYDGCHRDGRRPCQRQRQRLRHRPHREQVRLLHLRCVRGCRRQTHVCGPRGHLSGLLWHVPIAEPSPAASPMHLRGSWHASAVISFRVKTRLRRDYQVPTCS